MRRTIEAIFRHPMQLLLLLVIPLAVSLVIAYKLPRSYQSSASLWALRRYEIIGASGPETDLTSTPAETQVSALTELLQSRDFDLSVAQSTQLRATLNLSQSVSSNPQLLGDALALEISRHVQVTGKGYNLYEVAYANRNPDVAQQVVAAVVQRFVAQSQKFTVAEGQQLLDGYQTQLAQAKTAADSASTAEARYLVAHPELSKPGATPLNDPQYAQLDAQRLQAQSTLQNIQSSIAAITQEIAVQGKGQDAFFKIIDSPVAPDVSLSRTKTFLEYGGIGAGLGVVVCVVYILALFRRDRTLYTPRDLQRVLPYPVLMQLPQLTPRNEGS